MEFISSIFVFFLGWIVCLVGAWIFGAVGDVDVIVNSIFYLAAVITYFSLKIINLLQSKDNNDLRK